MKTIDDVRKHLAEIRGHDLTAPTIRSGDATPSKADRTELRTGDATSLEQARKLQIDALLGAQQYDKAEAAIRADERAKTIEYVARLIERGDFDGHNTSSDDLTGIAAFIRGLK